ncbi:MAG: hypothetical protein K0S70_117 [Microbacterium sp.]|jgi:hypothetical protein|nr:hypothetical protein [Microbacterium sp.]
MPTRDLSNKRVQLWLGLASGVTDFTKINATQINALLPCAPAVRWDGLDFGMQASDQEDDRSLDDDATETLRGFMQFGGGVPFFFPKATDTSSILRQAFNLVKTRGTELVLVERIGFVDRRTPAAAGDWVNLYKVMTDGYEPDTEGTGGYAYIQSLLPRGSVAPWIVVDAATPTAVTVAGGAVTGAVGTLALRRATYEGNDVTRNAEWTSSNQAVARVTDGIIEIVGAGTANVTAKMPGSLASTAVTVTSP